MTQPHIILTVGLPCSGKSTYVKQHYPDHTIISSDLFIEAEADRLGKTYNEVFSEKTKEAEKWFNETFDYCLSKKQDIIIDRTNLSQKTRRKYIDKAKSNGYRVSIIVVEASKKLHKKFIEQRSNKTVPESIMFAMASAYEKDWDALQDLKYEVSEFIEVRFN